MLKAWPPAGGTTEKRSDRCSDVNQQINILMDS